MNTRVWAIKTAKEHWFIISCYLAALISTGIIFGPIFFGLFATVLACTEVMIRVKEQTRLKIEVAILGAALISFLVFIGTR